MYKIIINNLTVYETDDMYQYMSYCIKNHYINHLVVNLLPDDYTLKLTTQ